VSLIRLPVLIFIGLSMIFGPSMILRMKAGRLTWNNSLTQSTRDPNRCSERTLADEGLETGSSPVELPPSSGGCATQLFSIADEEETDGDELFPGSESEPTLAKPRRERSLLAQQVPDSHVSDLSRRPPRARIA
jgi:hypothetical protein